MCEEQLMDDGTGEFSILKESHPVCESQTVSDMVENWENPIFNGPEKVRSFIQRVSLPKRM